MKKMLVHVIDKGTVIQPTVSSPAVVLAGRFFKESLTATNQEVTSTLCCAASLA